MIESFMKYPIEQSKVLISNWKSFCNYQHQNPKTFLMLEFTVLWGVVSIYSTEQMSH